MKWGHLEKEECEGAQRGVWRRGAQARNGKELFLVCGWVVCERGGAYNRLVGLMARELYEEGESGVPIVAGGAWGLIPSVEPILEAMKEIAAPDKQGSNNFYCTT